jgi:hypothetical protein
MAASVLLPNAGGIGDLPTSTYLACAPKRYRSQIVSKRENAENYSRLEQFVLR